MKYKIANTFVFPIQFNKKITFAFKWLFNVFSVIKTRTSSLYLDKESEIKRKGSFSLRVNL